MQNGSPAAFNGLHRYAFLTTRWADSADVLSAIRRQVFVIEQQVAEYEEWDAADETAIHAMVLSEKREPVGTGRLERSGKVGRVAVVSKHRGFGVGTGIMTRLLDEAQALGMERVYLNSQVQARPFYRQLGFVPSGKTFMEAGIAHVRMELRLDTIIDAER